MALMGLTVMLPHSLYQASLLDLLGQHGLEAGLAKQGHQLLHPRRLLARGLADDELVAEVVLHMARPVERATGMHHAADDVVAGDGLRNRAAGVHGRQAGAGQRTAKAFKEPPGHAVHGGEHHGAGSEQRGDGLRHARHGRCLHGHDHQVLHAQVGRVAAGAHGHRGGAARAFKPQAVVLHGLQRVAARHHADVAAGLRQAHADPAADGAGAVDGYFHGMGQFL
jgi:hypothetical protein